MKAATALTLSRDLMQVMRQFPRLRFREDSIEDLTTGEKGLLAMLGMSTEESKTTMTATDISALLQITPAGVTHLLNPLEEHGYIERLPDPKDRRIVRVGLTPRGARTAKALAGEAQRRLMGLIDHLGEQESRNLISLLSRAIEYFAAQSGT